MIDLRLLRTDAAAVRAALARRNSPELLAQVDRAVELEARSREVQSERDAIRAEVNELSKQVGAKRRDGDTAGAEAGIMIGCNVEATSALLHRNLPVPNSVPVAPIVRQWIVNSASHERFVCEAESATAADWQMFTPFASAPVP